MVVFSRVPDANDPVLILPHNTTQRALEPSFSIGNSSVKCLEHFLHFLMLSRLKLVRARRIHKSRRKRADFTWVASSVESTGPIPSVCAERRE